ncbi:MAG: Scr1 family TA system antitoxin-like transcriptional regulator, partial [Streptosporangiaceae bacterium]
DQTSSQYLEAAADIERYTLVFDHLRASALSPQRSMEFIGQVAGSMT